MAGTFGPTSAGFIRPTLAELITMEQTAMRSGIPGLAFAAGSPELALSEARAKLLNDQWAAQECAFNGFDITTQSGCALDIAARLQGFARLPNESDVNFIDRINSSVSGTGFVTGLETAISALQGVCRIRVFNNTSTVTDVFTGNPSGSFEVVYQGGDDSQIAEAIWQCSTGAINAGQTTTFFQDANGICREVALTQVTEIPYCIRITVDTYQLRGGCDNQTFENIVDATFGALSDKSINIGDPIFKGLIAPSIHASVGGIDIARIEFAPSSIDPTDGSCTCTNVTEDDWQEGALRLSHRERATFDRDCIQVIARDL